MKLKLPMNTIRWCRVGISLIFALCMMMPQIAGAQTAKNIKYSGVVKDQDGLSIVGATVMVDNTNDATITNVDGQFTLMSSIPNAKLIISYIGYETAEVAATSNKSITVTLESSSTEIDDVVVVGYGVQRKSDLTGSVASVSADNVLKNTPTTDIASSLQGTMAGVSVVAGGDPSSSSTIRIRGVNSVTADSEPLLVVDGFIGSSLQDLNPADIKSIEVLKDASATAVYGSRGANGVILVTTKVPEKEQLTVTFNSFLNIQTLANMPDQLSPYEFAVLANEYGQEYYTSAGLTPQVYYSDAELAAFKSGEAGFSYIDEMFQTAVSQNYELSIADRSKKSSILASLRYADKEGIIKSSGYDAINWRLKMDTKIREWWKAGIDVSGNLTTASGPRMSSYNGLLTTAQYYPNTIEPTDEFGNYNNVFAVGGSSNYNPMGHINENDSEARKLRNNIQGYVSFDIADGLTFRSQLGVSQYNSLSKTYNNEDSYYYFTDGQTRATVTSYTKWNWLNSNILNYTKEFNENHRINATAVYEQSYDNSYYYTAQAYGVYFDGLAYNSLADSASQLASSESVISTLMSGMVRVNYVLMNKYMFTVSARADGSSRLAEKWDYFPSAAVAWNIKEEGFLRDVDAVSSMKLRAGYGSVGNQAIEPYRIYSQMEPVINADGSTSYTTSRPASTDLKWERNEQYNLGLDMGFLNGRLTFAVDAYKKISKDVLMEVAQPVHTGWDSILKNACEIENNGIEVMISADPIVKRDFQWHTDVTLTSSKSIYSDIPTTDGTQVQAGEYANTIFMMIEGEQIGTFWGYTADGVWGTDEVQQMVTVVGSDGAETTGTYADIYKVVAGQEKILDLNNDGSIDENDKGIIGEGQSTFNWGWNNTFRYKNFDLSVFIVGYHGFDVYNTPAQVSLGGDIGGGMSADVISPNSAWLDRWTEDNQDTSVPGFVYVTNPTEGPTSTWVEKGDFVKVKSITLGYNAPQDFCSKLGVNNIRVYTSIQNPFTLTGYSGIDPESTLTDPMTTGVDWGQYPNTRNYIFGLNFSF
ncbi:MAG: TonB-dependent receptor [Rikenellaceae bacterium]